MTRDQLRQDSKFVEWVGQSQRAGHLDTLADLVDSEIGVGGYSNTLPHMAHINLGVQEAVRRTRMLLKTPLKQPDAPAPQATYGVNEP